MQTSPVARSRLLRPVDWPAFALAAATSAGFAGGWHWLLDLASHFRWYWFVGAVLWTVVAGRWCGRPALGCLALAVGAGGLALLSYWLPAAACRDRGMRLHVLSLNVLADNADKDRTLAYLEHRDADVVVLLEIDPAWAAALDRLAPRYPHRLIEARDGNFGIALLSRLPLAEARVIGLADGPPVIVAGLRGDAAECLLVAAHPPPPLSASWSARRDRQLAAIGDLAAADQRPVIVAGDLNTTPWSHGFRVVAGGRGLRDTAVGRGVQATWNARLPAPRLPIDHVLVSPEIGVHSRSVGPDVGSDHLPVEAVLFVP